MAVAFGGGGGGKGGRRVRRHQVWTAIINLAQ